jgi:hypothetical protein
MNARFLLLAVVLGLTLAPVARADQTLSAALEKLSKDQIAAFNREDVAATMGYAHTKGPAYATTQTELTTQFGEIDAKAEQTSFQYVGHDDEFAVARVKVKVTAPGAEGFYPNIVDTLVLFHQEGGAWKVWDTFILGGEIVK